MNKHVRAANTALAVLVSVLAISAAASCALLAPEPGRIEIYFDQEILEAPQAQAETASASRAIAADGDLAFVRVYLESQGGLIPLGSSAAVFEMNIPADNTIVIEGVPPVRDANLYVSLSVAGAASFRTVKYVQSQQSFNVVAGGTVEISLAVVASPFEDLVTERDAEGVDALELDGILYYLAGGKLVWTGGPAGGLNVVGTKGITKATGLGKGKVLNLLDGTAGVQCVWVNTDKGIYPLVDGLLGAELTGKTFEAEKPVLESGVLSLSYTDPVTFEVTDVDVAFYQYAGSAGVGISDADTWKWIDLYDVFDPASEYYSDGFSSLEDMIKGNESRLIADYVMTGEHGHQYGYLVVPAINSFRVDGSVVDDVEKLFDDADLAGEDVAFSDLQDVVLTGKTITVPKVGTAQPLIRGVSQAGELLFIGTDLGVFSATIKIADGAITSPQVPVALPRKVNVVRMRSKLIDGKVWTAVLGRGGSVHLIKDTAFVKEFRFFTGIPEFGGNAAATGDLFWTDAGLVITGTNGVVRLSNAELGKL